MNEILTVAGTVAYRVGHRGRISSSFLADRTATQYDRLLA